MNWDRIEGQWKQRRGKAVHHWGKLMNDELAAIAGKHEQLVGMLQEKYGIAKEEARQQIDAFKKIVGQLKKSNNDLMRAQKSAIKKEKLNRKSVNTKIASKRRPAQRNVSTRS
ncbi:MAG: CsbD family protein [Bacteroidetes bacterium]|nr:CsbD family protein [Bacteroidota bacterium]